MSCSHKKSCAMFPIISLSSALQIWQTFYCDGDYKNCQRYLRSIAGEPVASTLLPNGKTLELNSTTTPRTDRAPSTTTTNAAPIAPSPKPSPTPASSPAAHDRPATGGTSHSSYYLRFQSRDGGALQRALDTLRELAVGIDLSAHKAGDGGLQICTVITEQAPEMNVYRAIVRIEDMADVVGNVRSVRLDTRTVA